MTVWSFSRLYYLSDRVYNGVARAMLRALRGDDSPPPPPAPLPDSARRRLDVTPDKDVLAAIMQQPYHVPTFIGSFARFGDQGSADQQAVVLEMSAYVAALLENPAFAQATRETMNIKVRARVWLAVGVDSSCSSKFSCWF